MAVRPLRLQNLYLIAALLGLAASVLYLSEYGESGQFTLATEAETETLRRADIFLSSPTGIKYNRDGSVAYQWRADSAERLHDGRVQLYAPVYTGLVDGQREWTAQARTGELAADGQAVSLDQDVIVLELIHAARIDTDNLLIDLQRSEISTQAPVTLRLPNGSTRSVGLRASLAQQRVELLSEVHGHYESY